MRRTSGTRNTYEADPRSEPAMRSPVSRFFERPGSEPDSGHATAEGASGSPAWIGFENAQRASCCNCALTAVRAVYHEWPSILSCTQPPNCGACRCVAHTCLGIFNVMTFYLGLFGVLSFGFHAMTERFNYGATPTNIRLLLSAIPEPCHFPGIAGR